MRLTNVLLWGLAAAAPNLPATPVVQERDLGQLLGTINGILDVPRNGGKLTGALIDSLVEELGNLVPIATPTTPEAAAAAIASIFAHKPTQLADLVESSAHLILSGLTKGNLKTLLVGYNQASYNNDNNNNPREPSKPIYPVKATGDAPYSLDEATLRRWIHIPAGFTYGKKHPVILIPGSGERGGNAFYGNVIKYLTDKPWADPVWLNPTGYMLDDAQQNGEMVAYAINYISGISGGCSVALISESQGSLSGQWALKYWPSARQHVDHFLPVSGDFKGTYVAPIVCSPLLSCPPALVQQDFNSTFVRALARNGGDSALVPTTSIYSSFIDEIVEPRQGPSSSGVLLDAHGVGVSNVDVQRVCAGNNAAGLYTHENVLLHPLVPALIEDALTRRGPARPEHLDLARVCSTLFGQATLEDLINSESIIPVAVYQLLVYRRQAQGFTQPPLFPYAQQY